jgi:hypothetical protein
VFLALTGHDTRESEQDGSHPEDTDPAQGGSPDHTDDLEAVR